MGVPLIDFPCFGKCASHEIERRSTVRTLAQNGRVHANELVRADPKALDGKANRRPIFRED